MFRTHAWMTSVMMAIVWTGTTARAQDAGPIVAWGSNSFGQCNVPAPNADFIAIAAGPLHSLGLKAEGSARAWGINKQVMGFTHEGEVYWSTTGQCNVPSPNADFIAVAGGAVHSLGLKSNASIVSWGDNGIWDPPGSPVGAPWWLELGQCDVPPPNADFSAIAAGCYHSIGLKANGSIMAWGCNDCGQCNVPAPNADFIAIAAGYDHSLGLKANGSIVAWGRNDYGQCNVPAPNADFIAIAAGSEHSLGLKANGSIAAWGRNNYGQRNVPPPNADFVAIAAAHHSLGLKADGSIVAWGANHSGQCDVPAPNADFIAIAAGAHHSLGLKAIPGDLDADGDLDMDDYELFRSTFGRCDGDAAFLPRADYDGDGCVTLVDYQIWLGYCRARQAPKASAPDGASTQMRDAPAQPEPDVQMLDGAETIGPRVPKSGR